MSLTARTNETDGVVLTYVRHAAPNFTEARTVFKSLGFEICDVVQNEISNKNATIRLLLNQSFIEVTNSFEFLSKPDGVAVINALGFGVNNIEAGQGRLTLNGFHPLPLITNTLKIKTSDKQKIELEHKVFRLKESDMPEACTEFIEIAGEKPFFELQGYLHKNCINEINAVILCVEDPNEVVARYCWLTNQGSPKRLFDQCWQIRLHQRCIVIFHKDEINKLFKFLPEAKYPSIYGYSLISKNLQKTHSFLLKAGWSPIRLTDELLFLSLPGSVGGNLFISQDAATFPWHIRK